MWLNEGIATVSVDRFLEKQTIRDDTLQFIKDYQPKKKPPSYRELSRMDREAIAYHGSRGYWMVRYLEQAIPGFLRDTFAEYTDTETIEANIAEKLGIEPENFWEDIDDIVADYFMNSK
ncbi:hypothetical protein ACFLYQ_03490 [Chloroflexota bacterium]